MQATASHGNPSPHFLKKQDSNQCKLLKESILAYE